MKKEDLARDEFEQLIKDDKDFEEQWAEKDGSYKEKSFKEWYENVYKV